MLKDQFNAVEVIEMAKDIEKRGLDFYQVQAERAEDEKLKKLFTKLANDERNHYQRFVELGQLIQESVKKEAEYVYDPEVSAYLQAIVEFTIFPSEAEVQVTDLEDALQIAIYAEKDSILFYQEMLEHNPAGETAVVLKKLIAEEKEHLLSLVKYEAEMA